MLNFINYCPFLNTRNLFSGRYYFLYQDNFDLPRAFYNIVIRLFNQLKRRSLKFKNYLYIWRFDLIGVLRKIPSISK